MRFKKQVGESLTNDYDFIIESDHFHLEFNIK